jgi:hypothetical protein
MSCSGYKGAVSGTAKVVYWCIWIVLLAILTVLPVAYLVKIALAIVISVILGFYARFAARRKLWPD